MNEKKMPPVHPGEILLEDFLLPMGLSQYRLAKEMKVYPRKINEIVHGKRSITADTALRLAQFFGTSAELWMNLQAHYDLEVARDKIEQQVKQEGHILSMLACQSRYDSGSSGICSELVYLSFRGNEESLLAQRAPRPEIPRFLGMTSVRTRNDKLLEAKVPFWEQIPEEP